MKSTPEKLAYMKKYRLKNADRIHAYQRSYYWSHHEEMKAYQAEYRKRKRETQTEEERQEHLAYMREMYHLVYREKKVGKKKGAASEQADSESRKGTLL